MKCIMNEVANRSTAWRLAVAAGALALVAGCGTEIAPTPTEVAPTHVPEPSVDSRNCVDSPVAARAEKLLVCVD